MPDSFKVSGVFGMFFIIEKGLPHFFLVRQPLLTATLPEIRQTCQGRPASRAFILPLMWLAVSGISRAIDPHT